MKIKIPFIGYSTNKIYAGIHWTKRKRQADEAHLIVKLSCAKMKQVDNLADLEFTPYVSTRRLDTSNYSASCKMIEDGLVACGVLKGDGQKHVGRIIINPPVKLKHGDQSYMIVEITEVK